MTVKEGVYSATSHPL